MIHHRVIAAVAAMLTALLLQGALIGPLTIPAAVSLPAVLVAAVALVDGPGAGMALGFSCGLLADLAGTHPVGVFALGWLAVGVSCGLLADRRGLRADAAAAAIVCALAAAGTGLLLAVIDGTGAVAVLRLLVPTALGDAVLALAVVPLVRAFLRSDRMRPAASGLGLGRRA